MKILLIGDIVGNSGVKKVKEIIPEYKKENNIRFQIKKDRCECSGPLA